VALLTELVDGAAVAANGDIYLSTISIFDVPGVSGENADVFVFTPTSTGTNTAGSYSPTLFFDGSAAGLGTDNVDAIDLP
jgi:hypothetical protein